MTDQELFKCFEEYAADNGLTAEQSAKRIGICRASYFNWKNGAPISKRGRAAMLVLLEQTPYLTRNFSYPQVLARPALQEIRLPDREVFALIERYRRKFNLTAKMIYDELGVNKNTWTNWKYGAPITDKNRKKMLDLLKNYEELWSANEKMNEYYNSQAKHLKAKEFFGDSFIPVISQDDVASLNPGVTPLSDAVKNLTEEKVVFPNSEFGDFAIKVTGGSLYAHLPLGTIIHVRPFIQNLENGKRVIAVTDSGNILYKIYSKTANTIHLKSLEADDNKVLSFENGRGIRFICRVIATLRNENE